MKSKKLSNKFVWGQEKEFVGETDPSHTSSLLTTYLNVFIFLGLLVRLFVRLFANKITQKSCGPIFMKLANWERRGPEMNG